MKTGNRGGSFLYQSATCSLLLTMHLIFLFQESRRPPVQSGRGVHHQRRPGGINLEKWLHIYSPYISHNGTFCQTIQIDFWQNSVPCTVCCFFNLYFILTSDHMCNYTTKLYQLVAVIKKFCVCLTESMNMWWSVSVYAFLLTRARVFLVVICF